MKNRLVKEGSSEDAVLPKKVPMWQNLPVMRLRNVLAKVWSPKIKPLTISSLQRSYHSRMNRSRDNKMESFRQEQ